VNVQEHPLRVVGCVLLLSGGFLVICALTLLSALSLRLTFSLAALAVEGLGIALLVGSYMPSRENGS